MSTVAGTGQPGYLDGPAIEAQFRAPNDLVTASDGTIYLAEFYNHTVRKISTNGMVSTVAGTGKAGYRDGLGNNALFNSPAGIAIDAKGNLYVTEWNNHRVRRISGGSVTTVAGTNQSGFADGLGSAALFNTPDGIAADPEGNLYVVEQGNHAVRRIDTRGNVVTIAGQSASGYRDGEGLAAQFNAPGAIMWHPNGSVFVADTYNHAIRRLDLVNDPSETPVELHIALHPVLTVTGDLGATYRIEGAEAAPELVWKTLGTITLTNSPQLWLDLEPASSSNRLYRAVLSE